MDKKWLVMTGGSCGIGLATAGLYLDKGWQVINLSKRVCPLEGVHSIQVDIRKIEEYPKVQDKINTLIGKKAVVSLIHNAATYKKDTICTLSQKSLKDVLSVNVIFPLLLNQICLPFMASGSSILYVGSTLSEKAVKGAASYIISKHALVGLMRSTCQDLAGKFIHTACICPGFTDTQMLREHLGQNKNNLECLRRKTTFGRLIQPLEVAKTLLFFSDNPVINGAVVHTNLGQIET